MINWIRELYEIFTEYERNKAEIKRDSLVCDTCEALKTQLELANIRIEKLMNKLINPVTSESARSEIEPELIRPRHVSWNVKKQMLEAEDRERARVLRNAPIPDSVKVEDLEEELGISS